MKNNKIRELFEKLQDELERIGPLDEKGRDLVDHITADITNLLDDSSKQPDETILQGLQDSIDHFKIEHPQLTMALSEMMSILSNAGI
ncbi:MAG TPA: DUF4404 family protein [Anaerolineales bacterium]|nr:DUF4404 family protein [Anaerolineales bacterium]